MRHCLKNKKAQDIAFKVFNFLPKQDIVLFNKKVESLACAFLFYLSASYFLSCGTTTRVFLIFVLILVLVIFIIVFFHFYFFLLFWWSFFYLLRLSFLVSTLAVSRLFFTCASLFSFFDGRDLWTAQLSLGLLSLTVLHLHFLMEHAFQPAQ